VARVRQLSLLSRGPLLDPRVLEAYMTDARGTAIPQEAQRVRAINDWLQAVKEGGATKETTLEQAFNHKILVETLGYELFPSAKASAWPKPGSGVTGISGEPDVALGWFHALNEPLITAVLELKSPGTALDAPQARTDPKTPVEQAFEYGERILGVQWVLVSDMKVIRLYSVESPHESIEFDLDKCRGGGPDFRTLYHLLSYEALVGNGTASPTAALLAKSTSRQFEIRDAFYRAYYAIRLDLLTAVSNAVKGLHETPSRRGAAALTRPPTPRPAWRSASPKSRDGIRGNCSSRSGSRFYETVADSRSFSPTPSSRPRRSAHAACYLRVVASRNCTTWGPTGSKVCGWGASSFRFGRARSP
jgi:hypothetical protein